MIRPSEPDENGSFKTLSRTSGEDAEWAAIAAAFLTEARGQSGSAGTVRMYTSVLRRWFHVCPHPTFATTAQVYAFAYGAGPSGKPPSPSTIVVRLAAISGLYDFARRMGLVQRNPADEIKRPKARPPLPKGLAPEQLRQLLAVIPPGLQGERDRAVLLLLAFTGMRRAEVLSLRVGDIDGAGVANWRAKGGVQRRREIPAPALAAIRQYLDARFGQAVPPRGGEQLFPLTSQALYRQLQRHADAAGLGHVTPHVLRHTAAKLRRLAGASLEDVQALLGHRSVATTARYLARLESEKDSGWEGVASLLGL